MAGKIIHAHGLREQTFLDWPFYPKQYTYLMLIKIPQLLFKETEKSIAICMECEKTTPSQNNPEQKGMGVSYSPTSTILQRNSKTV